MKLMDLWRHVIAEWKIKVFLGGAITLAFGWGYFRLARLPEDLATQMPELAIDRAIPFLPAAAIIYLSQFVTMPAIIWLMGSRRQLLACCRGLALLIAVSFIIFYGWPTAVVRPELPTGAHFFYGLIASTDLPHNACPSLHAAFAVFTAGCAWEVFRDWKNGHLLIATAWLWNTAILASTLLTKQHVFLDLIAGSALGAAGWWTMVDRSARSTEFRSAPAATSEKAAE
ncbi:MAG: phosphatase PAP2 family protein [Opitutaceae bacterium]|nr:phosphatase PAP2 family protein [Opitutaceae bacterium]